MGEEEGSGASCQRKTTITKHEMLQKAVRCWALQNQKARENDGFSRASHGKVGEESTCKISISMAHTSWAVSCREEGCTRNGLASTGSLSISLGPEVRRDPALGSLQEEPVGLCFPAPHPNTLGRKNLCQPGRSTSWPRWGAAHHQAATLLQRASTGLRDAQRAGRPSPCSASETAAALPSTPSQSAR